MTQTSRREHRAERRTHPRAVVQWKTAIGYVDQRELVRGTLRDVSTGGLCVRAPLMAMPGDEVLVLLSLKERTLPAIATVIRSENFAVDDIELRMRFTTLPGMSRDRLLHFFGVTAADLGEDAGPEGPADRLLEETAPPSPV